LKDIATGKELPPPTEEPSEPEPSRQPSPIVVRHRLKRIAAQEEPPPPTVSEKEKLLWEIEKEKREVEDIEPGAVYRVDQGLMHGVILKGHLQRDIEKREQWVESVPPSYAIRRTEQGYETVPHGPEYYKSVSPSEKERLIDEYLRTHKIEHDFTRGWTVDGKRITQISGGYHYIGTLPEYKRRIAWDQISKTPTQISEEKFEALPDWLKPIGTLSRTAFEVSMFPFTLPQAGIKYLTGGKTLFLPDISQMIGEHKIGPGGVISPAISEVWLGKDVSYEKELQKKYPLETAFATVGEIFGLYLGGKTVGTVYGPVYRGGKYGISQLKPSYSKLQSSVFGKFPKVESVYGKYSKFYHIGAEKHIMKSMVRKYPFYAWEGTKAPLITRVGTRLKTGLVEPTIARYMEMYVPRKVSRSSILGTDKPFMSREQITTLEQVMGKPQRLGGYERIWEYGLSKQEVFMMQQAVRYENIFKLGFKKYVRDVRYSYRGYQKLPTATATRWSDLDVYNQFVKEIKPSGRFLYDPVTGTRKLATGREWQHVLHPKVTKQKPGIKWGIREPGRFYIDPLTGKISKLPRIGKPISLKPIDVGKKITLGEPGPYDIFTRKVWHFPGHGVYIKQAFRDLGYSSMKNFYVKTGKAIESSIKPSGKLKVFTKDIGVARGFTPGALQTPSITRAGFRMPGGWAIATGGVSLEFLEWLEEGTGYVHSSLG